MRPAEEGVVTKKLFDVNGMVEVAIEVGDGVVVVVVGVVVVVFVAVFSSFGTIRHPDA